MPGRCLSSVHLLSACIKYTNFASPPPGNSRRQLARQLALTCCGTPCLHEGSHCIFVCRPTSRRQWQAAGKRDALRCEGPTGDSQCIDALDRRDLLVHAGKLMGCVRGQGGCRAGNPRQVHLHSKVELLGRVGGQDGCELELHGRFICEATETGKLHERPELRVAAALMQNSRTVRAAEVHKRLGQVRDLLLVD